MKNVSFILLKNQRHFLANPIEHLPSWCHWELLAMEKNPYTFGSRSVRSEVFCVGSKGDTQERKMQEVDQTGFF